jgi:hypothetical protein
MRKLIFGNILLISGLILILSSCTPDSCYDQTESFLKASFYSYTKRLPQPPDSITIYGLNRDTSKIYDKALKVQPAQIPLNASSDTSIFIIKINGITDTVEFRYISYPHLISKECGFTFYHNLDTIQPVFTKHTIDSIHLSKRNITTVNEENIRIFY